MEVSQHFCLMVPRVNMQQREERLLTGAITQLLGVGKFMRCSGGIVFIVNWQNRHGEIRPEPCSVLSYILTGGTDVKITSAIQPVFDLAVHFYPKVQPLKIIP